MGRPGTQKGVWMKPEMTTKEAAQYLGIKYEALRYLVTKTTKGPLCHMNGGKFVFREKHLHDFKVQGIRDIINSNGLSTTQELKLETEIVILEMSRVANKIKGSVEPGDQWEKLADAMKSNAAKITAFIDAV